MDARFLPAQVAIRSDQADELERLLREDPSLASATSRAPGDHTTLLNCLVLTLPARRSLDQLIRLFSQFGGDLNGSLIAAASIGNVAAAKTLLELGAPSAGVKRWSPLEEALYWGHVQVVELLLKHGAPIDNLRKAAALGDLQAVQRCFDDDGKLNHSTGEIAWPFGDTIPHEIRRDQRELLNNALVFAAAWGQTRTAGELLRRGAEINAIPAGFDFAGSALHYAALHNRREMADWLLDHGADPALRDAKVKNTPDGWADHAGHRQLAAHLRSIREGRSPQAGNSSIAAS